MNGQELLDQAMVSGLPCPHVLSKQEAVLAVKEEVGVVPHVEVAESAIVDLELLNLKSGQFPLHLVQLLV